MEAALSDLRAAGKDLSREKLLELVKNASSETRLRALVSLARPVMDYVFFQLLSERIDRARGDGRVRLTELRTKLLEMTEEIDRQVELHVQEVRQLIQAILDAEDVGEAMKQSLPAVDEYFAREVEQMLQAARRAGDLEQSSKLQQMIEAIQEASSGPPELALIEEYVDLPNEKERQQFLETHQDEITPDFLNLLANIAMQVQSGEDQAFAERVTVANRQALRFSMRRSMNA